MTTPENEPKTPQFKITGSLFFNICTYVGRQPFGEVFQVRHQLMEVQRAQNCLNPAQLPESVSVPPEFATGLMNFLYTRPCDDVYNLIAALEQEFQAYGAQLEAQSKASPEASSKASPDEQTPQNE